MLVGLPGQYGPKDYGGSSAGPQKFRAHFIKMKLLQDISVFGERGSGGKKLPPCIPIGTEGQSKSLSFHIFFRFDQRNNDTREEEGLRFKNVIFTDYSKKNCDRVPEK
ncbi:hypothetical protein JTB14_021097 [Gonioctena quinquepunctata]|nr:hypothetical protein JTB14_021097 [Gonioctena quinquepunctata]